ncbi:MAG TPA: hypothetical protein ENJ28_05625 [Gammaproteobacteria bacterium]|nr:hypothetical protein [Gammaproteobacteria bacterium]
MNKKQATTRASKIQKKKQALRKQLWGDVDPATIWNRKENDGYTTIPRTMPIIFQIMDNLAEKSKPVSMVYFSLWCRVFDESFIEIKSQEEMAFESGFSGQRAVSTWKSRMKNLASLGFIDAKEGAAGEYNYVLLINPYMLLKKYHEEDKVQAGKYNSLFARAQEVGASDLE